ncbi:MAG: glycosyltransferase family 4 protein [Bacteroidales bacterium]|nr:glycosyltransferase family 4 protein [Bacteroidales bacterium]
MTILYLHQYFTLPSASGGTRSYDLATSFAAQGHKVTIVSATSNRELNNGKLWNVINKDGLEIHYIYMPYSNEMNNLQRMWVFFKFLWLSTFRILSIKTDVVLATSTPLTIGIPALVKKWFGRIPYIFEVRDVWPEAVIAIGAIKNKMMQKMLYGLEKMIYKNAMAIVPLSVDMKASIDRRYPQNKHKTEVVIPNISEINRFQQKDIKNNIIEKTIGFTPRFSVLYAGTFGRVNGVDYVIKLAKQTLELDPQLVYILMGKGVMKESVRSLAEKEGVLNKNVFILESVSKNDLPKWYASASMGSSFVIDIKELWANSANKFFDTLAAGKPVLINHEGWQANTIRDKNIGYVLSMEVDKKAAIDFVEYTKNTSLYGEQSRNALQLAKKEYSLEVAVERYERILNVVKIK